MLDYVETRYLKPDGDLDGSGVPWFEVYRSYKHAWLCCGAVMAGRRDLARKLSGFIATRNNAAPGGIFADEARTTEEITTTSMAGIASLYAGKQELAIAAVEGVDVVLAGPMDLSAALGHIGETNHPDVPRFLEDFPARVASAGKVPGIALGGYEPSAKAWSLGYRFINFGNLYLDGFHGIKANLARLKALSAKGE